MCLVAACASAPPVVPKPPEPSFEQKMSWIVRLEDQRILKDPEPPAPAARPVQATPGRARAALAVVPPPPPTPDLTRLLTDGEARIRRRAALAVGRAGLPEGIDALVPLFSDPDVEVRQMAAFALGLIGDPRAAEPLAAALQDPSPLVQGSAAEALGLVGATAQAGAIGAMAAAIVQSGSLAALPSGVDEASRNTPSAAFRLALTALVRLRAYDALAAAVLDGSGQPRVRWWPVAFALQRLEDPRALAALVTLAGDPDPYTRAFAARGLGAMKHADAVPPLLPLASGSDRSVAIEAIRALGRLGDPAAVATLMSVAQKPRVDPHVFLEAVTALGAPRGEVDPRLFEALLDVLQDRRPAVRAAAIKGLASMDPEGFVTVLSGLDPDPHWMVRSALATTLGTLRPEVALPRLRLMLDDQDKRVIPAVLAALAALKASEAAPAALERLKAEDPVVRAAAAGVVGDLKPQNGIEPLASAYRAGVPDQLYIARTAALSALAKYGPASPQVREILTEALQDRDWSVRVRAASLLKELDPAGDFRADIRPAPLRQPLEFYSSPAAVNPPVSTQVYIETDRGLIQIEMAMLDAPLTVANFVKLAREGFFDGVPFHRVVPDFVVQGGDPRGDGEGGPGYTIRDEINQRPYLRGTVGMALDWADTGGSQFFITHSPQPHLDARYTVFGRVTSGMEIVDQIEQWDAIRKVRVWDGETLK
jgi:HEAT repeat protein/cyclophilin family peptidyl-prolyl cis-trans isomerase